MWWRRPRASDTIGAMDRRQLLALPALGLLPTLPATPRNGWDGERSTAALTAAEARKIVADPAADIERRRSAMLVLESESCANLQALAKARRCRDLQSGWKIAVSRVYREWWRALLGR